MQIGIVKITVMKYILIILMLHHIILKTLLDSAQGLKKKNKNKELKSLSFRFHNFSQFNHQQNP